MKSNEPMNIVIGSSKELAIFTAVTLKSLFDNNQQERFNIFFYYGDDMADTVNTLKKLTIEAGHQFYPMYITEERKKSLTVGNMSWWHTSIWYRYYCIDDLGDVYDRVLILGNDVIVQNNIRELYDTDLSDKAILAVSDMGHYSRLYPALCYNRELERFVPSNISVTEYVNTDVVLLDLKKLKGRINARKMARLYVDKRLWALDQDVVNFCYRDILMVDHNVSHNFMPVVAHKILDKDRYKKFVKEALIVHFSALKPWSDYDENLSHDVWLSYAKRLDCFGSIITGIIQVNKIQK